MSGDICWRSHVRADPLALEHERYTLALQHERGEPIPRWWKEANRHADSATESAVQASLSVLDTLRDKPLAVDELTRQCEEPSWKCASCNGPYHHCREAEERETIRKRPSAA